MVSWSATGGLPRYIDELTSALRRHAGIPTRWVASTDLEPGYAQDVARVLPPLRHRSAYASPVSWLAGRWSYYRTLTSALLEEVDRGRPDLVHFQELPPLFGRGLLRRVRRLGVPVVLTVHNTTSHQHRRRWHRLVRDADFRRAWRQADALIVHTEAIGQRVGEILGSHHPPVVTAVFGAWTRGGARRDAAQPREPARLLMFGTVRPTKGYEIALEALRHLSHDFTLTIAGEPHTRAYGAEVKGLAAGLGDRVRFVERHVPAEDVVTLFHDHDLVLLPYTTFEAQSGVLRDAIACETPVVVSDVPDLADVVCEFGIGTVASATTGPGIATAVRELCDGSRYAGAVRACKEARRRLTWARAAEATVRAYRIAAEPHRS
jgi:glycosyltransferase involved in cell wall biosynthesis